jgi:hypothetical protein
MPLVYLQSSEENMVPELALHSDHVLAEKHGTWCRPVATAADFISFLDRWRTNDPNGEWGYALEVDGNVRLHYGDENFPLFGVTDDGHALYDLTGWPWIETDDSTPTNISTHI